MYYKQFSLKRKKLLIPLLIVGFLFFVIGFEVGISGFLTPFLQDALNLSVTESYLAIVAIFSAFVVFGTPAGWIVKQVGFKASMVIAFFILAFGMIMIVPSANMASFPIFLLALFTGGIGNALMQASLNPYVTLMGPHESATSRLCFMGIMNKLAWWIGPVFLGLFLDLKNVHLSHLSLPFYIVTGILVILGILMYFAPLPEVKAKGENEHDENFSSTYASGKSNIFQMPHLMLGVLAFFFYVGVETLPMATIINFAKAVFGVNVENPEGYVKYVPIGMFIGYFFGLVVIPGIISQSNALKLFTVFGLIAAFCVIFLSGKMAVYSLAGIGFANSIIGVAIWPLAIVDLGKFTKKGASFMVMGIVGGAVLPFIFGILIDKFKSGAVSTINDYQSAYWIFIPAYLFIFYFATLGYKIRRK
ncbi:MAG: sugar MFS transporter [Mariniphaga sp.]|nr:sugar MFS transporter [Mariniphaga sp.]